MNQSKAYSAASKTSRLGLTTIPRREPTERDVQIEILFCGICHSDLHYARDEWHDVMPTVYPCVPGHEIVGRVTAVGAGAGVSKFKAGDTVGVGCMVGSGNRVSGEMGSVCNCLTDLQLLLNAAHGTQHRHSISRGLLPRQGLWKSAGGHLPR